MAGAVRVHRRRLSGSTRRVPDLGALIDVGHEGAVRRRSSCERLLTCREPAQSRRGRAPPRRAPRGEHAAHEGPTRGRTRAVHHPGGVTLPPWWPAHVGTRRSVYSGPAPPRVVAGRRSLQRGGSQVRPASGSRVLLFVIGAGPPSSSVRKRAHARQRARVSPHAAGSSRATRCARARLAAWCRASSSRIDAGQAAGARVGAVSSATLRPKRPARRRPRQTGEAVVE